MKNIIYAIILSFFSLAVISFCSDRSHEPVTRTSNLSEPSTSSSPSYEDDLVERCKDWVYYRNRAYSLARKGDKEGAAEAGAIMNRYHDDLRKRFSEKEITEAIDKIEASGYKVGFK